jgi:hypothetical protein
MRVETRFMVIFLAVRSLVSRVVAALARLPSGGVSGPHTDEVIARLRGGR